MKKFGARSFCRFTAASGVGELFIYDFIGGGIFGGGVTAQQVAESLKEAEGASELRVFINSPGGNIFEGSAIYNLIARFPARKTVFVDGIAASMASVIALVGDRIITAPNALWMIHEPSGGCSGTVAEIERGLEALRSLRSLMVDTYVKRTKQKREDIEAWMAATTYMDAKTAKERGFTDEIGEEPGDRMAQARSAEPTLDEKFESFLKTFGNTPERFRLAASASTQPPGAPAPKENTMDKNLLIALLGLQASASDADIQAAITKLIETGRETSRVYAALTENHGKLLAATGKGTLEEALGTIAAWKAGAERATQLTAEIASLKEATEKTERAQLIAAALADGKLSPAMAEKWAPTQSVASLKAFLEAAPKLVVEPKREAAKQGEAGALDPTTLTASQQSVLKAMGVEPKAAAK